MKKIILLFSLAVLVACNNEKKQEAEHQNQDVSFDAYKERFILHLWELYPGWASSQGYHNYDSILVVPNQEQRNKELAFCKANLDSLKKFDITALSDNNKTDYHMIEDQLNSSQWYITEYKSFEWNPSDYNVCSGFAEMLANNYDSLGTRLHNFYLRMRNVKAYYETAKLNIKNPTIEHTQLAIDQNLGGISVFEEDLIAALNKDNPSKEIRDSFIVSAKAAVAAIKDYVNFLKTLKNPTPHNFRLGKNLYEKKFEHDIQSSLSAHDAYKKAVEHKTELHKQMFELTQQLWPKYLKNKKMPEDKLLAIKQMIDVLSIKHVAADSFQTEIEHQIPKLVSFIKQKDLIYIDPSKPLVVRKEPAYMAGVAGASISSPGPYDKNGNTYYNVGGFTGWSKDQIESYLKEYNHYILQILNIHEAIPGHYTQLIYSNQSPSIIKSIFGNGAMIEGWAVYTERMMLESDYENSPEMWLMYYKWNLRTTCNTILDYAVHVNDLTKEDAIDLLTNQAFQQQAEAEGKWRRVTLTQVQLCSYFTGYKEIYDFREELKKKDGDKFNLKQFHEKFLSYGSAPVKYIKELMSVTNSN